MAIETLLDLDTLSVEELVGRLRSAESRDALHTPANGNGGGTSDKLLLTEE